VRDRRVFVLLFAVTLNDRRLDRADKPEWSLREFAGTFYLSPRKNRDFSWAFASRFMVVLAYAFLTTYQAYYLLDKIGTAKADVPEQIFLGTLAQAAVVVAASVNGRRTVRHHRRRRDPAGAARPMRPSAQTWPGPPGEDPAMSRMVRQRRPGRRAVRWPHLSRR